MAIQHTANFNLPFPDVARTDTADVPRDIAALANATDAALVTERRDDLIGEIKMWPAVAAPAGFVIADGSVLAQAGTYAALFAIVGAAFNTGGEGAGNFRLPNLQGRMPVGLGTAVGAAGATARTLAEKGGEQLHVLSIAELAGHTHPWSDTPGVGIPPLSSAPWSASTWTLAAHDGTLRLAAASRRQQPPPARTAAVADTTRCRRTSAWLSSFAMPSFRQQDVNDPHFQMPFRLGGINGGAFVNEQDSIEDIVTCVRTIMAYPIGSRMEVPAFGIPDILFRVTQIDDVIASQLKTAILSWEGRARIDVNGQPLLSDEFIKGLSNSVGAIDA